MTEPIASVMPSGAQHEISRGAQRAVVVEVGGGLRSYEGSQGPLLDGYSADEACSGGRGQPLIPWPNRVRDGRYEFGGASYQLALTEPAAQNAIHGLVRWANWTVADRAPDRVVMEYILHPQTGWPGSLRLSIEYALHDRGLTVTTLATNVGQVTVPYGAGQHPYLTLGTESIDPLTLQVPARTHLESDQRGIPTAVHQVDGSPFDYRTARRLGDARLDVGYTDLIRDDDERARATIATEDGARRLELWVDRGYSYLMVFTGDTLAADARRRGLAIEPMTCAPNAFQSGHGLVKLTPGVTHSASWGISQS